LTIFASRIFMSKSTGRSLIETEPFICFSVMK
jgi:hypothetical protein